MPDAPTPHRTDPDVDTRPYPGTPLTPDRIDSILADFRDWLEALNGELPDEPVEDATPVSLGSLMDQFTALRHEVNLQTRAARSATEQTTEVLKRLDQADPNEPLRPVVGVLLAVADALAVSLQHVERAREVAGPMARELTSPPARRSVLDRLLGRLPVDERRAEAAERLHKLLAGVADGYTLSLRRVERALSPIGVVAIPTVGLPFDPETMEAIELVAAGKPSGTVVEETRRGYEWNGRVFRFAQVKVAR